MSWGGEMLSGVANEIIRSGCFSFLHLNNGYILN